MRDVRVPVPSLLCSKGTKEELSLHVLVFGEISKPLTLDAFLQRNHKSDVLNSAGMNTALELFSEH